MLSDIKLGQYFPGNSIIHRLDARLKIISLLFFLIAIFIFDSPLDYTIWTIILIGIILLSRIPLKLYYGSLKPILIIIIFTFILHAVSGEEVLYSWWIFKITSDGLIKGGFICLRLLLLVLASAALTFTTQSLVLADALESLMKPLKILRVPTHELAMMMTIALRFIPTLLEETDKIIKAQKSRGVDFSAGSIRKRIQAAMPILIPLFINSFRRADELAMAMEARCYRGGEGRTRLKQLQFQQLDYLVMIFGVVIVLLLLILKLAW